MVPLLVLALALPAGAQDDAVGPLRDYYSGNGLLNRGMYDLAAAEYRKFLDAHPDHAKAPLARYGLAVSLFRSGEYEQTVEELRRLTPGDGFPYRAEVLMINGQCHLALHRPKAAAEHFGNVVREHPRHQLADEAVALQAEALYEAGSYGRVERCCNLLEARWPESPQRERAELFGGLAQMALGRYPDATQRFEAMLASYPDGRYADRATLLLAQSLHRTGSWQRAASMYRRVIDRARQEFVPDAMYGLALVMHHGEDLHQASRMLDELLTRYPDAAVVPSARLLRGRVWFDLDDYSRALKDFEHLARDDGDLRDDAVYWSAKCSLRRGAHDQAAQQLAQALSRFPDSELVPEMTYDRAVALLRAGDGDAAIAVLEPFREDARLAEHPLTPDAIELTATAHHQQQRYSDSLTACETFAGRFPRHELMPTVAFLTAENSYLLGEYDRAADAYESLLQDLPDHPQADSATYRLGMALHHQHKYDEARPWLRQSVGARGVTPEAFRPGLLALGDGHFQRGEYPQAEQYLERYVAEGLDQPSADDALLKLGLARQRQGNPQAALASFTTLVERMPESPHRVHAIFERGQVLVELDRSDEAAVAFEQVLDEGPSSPYAGHAMSHLGALALAAGTTGAAAEWFAQSASSLDDPEARAEALARQGEVLVSSKRFDEAVPVFETLLSDYPDRDDRPRVAALHAVSLSRGDAASPNEALSAIDVVERDYGGDLDRELLSSLWYEKAWCLRQLDHDQPASVAYRQVLDADPSSTLAHHASIELADLEIEAERYGGAAELLRDLRRQGLNGGHVDDDLVMQCEYRLGVCEFHLGNTREAADRFEAYLAGDPDPELVPSASLLCGEALIKDGRHDRAVGHLERLVERYGDHPSARPGQLRLGDSYAALQQWKQSEQTFNGFLQRHRNDDLWFQARFGLGWAIENQGRLDEAIGHYRKVVDRHRGATAARAQFQIGECLFAQKQYDVAVRELLKVDILYAYPEWSAAALYEAGRCFRASGDPVNARKQFEQVVRDHAESKWAELARERLAELQDSGLPGH